MVWVELHENEASRATEHEILRSNHREMDRHTANSGKKSTKIANITRCLHDFEKPRLFFGMNTFTRSRLTNIKVIFIIDRATCFHRAYCSLRNETKRNETKPNETNQNETNKTKPTKTKPNKRNQPKRNQPKRNQNKTKPTKTKPNQTKPNKTKPNQTKPNKTKPNQTKPNKM